MRRPLLWITFALYVFVLLEVASRTFMALQFGAPFWAPRDVIDHYYPEIAPVVRLAPRPDDGSFDVLILGASVINDTWGNVAELLADGWSDTVQMPVRIHNLSKPSHTTLDSYYKYLNLDGARFDQVVLYHGINEVRANNAPPDVFRTDYSHYRWYEEVNRIHSHRELGVLAFPFVLAHGFSLAREMLGMREYVPLGQPRYDWVYHGKVVKTAPAFRRNVERIIELAHARGEPLVLMTFAFFVPEGGWPEQFEVQRSEWGVFRTGVRVWGREENVIAALEAHNRVIAELAAENPDVVFVDQYRLMPGDKQHFTDICHLTVRGCRAFADHVLEATRPPDPPVPTPSSPPQANLISRAKVAPVL